MSVAYGDIARVLGGARRRQVWVVLLAAVGFGAAGVVLCLLAGAGALGWGARGWVRPLALAAAGVSAVAAVLWAAATLLRTAWSDDAAARTVGGGDPGLRSDLVSSVELSRERGDIQASGRFSVALLDAHVTRTAERARAVRLAEVVPARLAGRGLAALGAVALLNVLLVLTAGAPLSKGYTRLFARAGPAGPSLDPITGDIELTFRYPAYMRREPKTLSGTGGEVRAPKGTEVELHTRADRKVEGAELEVTVDDPVQLPPSPRPSPPASRGEREGDGTRSALPSRGEREGDGTRSALPSRGEREGDGGRSALGSRGDREGDGGRAAPASRGEREGDGTRSALPSRGEREGDGGRAALGSRGDREGDGARPAPRRLALNVQGGRDLAGRLLVEGTGSYRFRFLDRRGRTVVEGPPIPVTVEPDLAPEARLVAPDREIEVDATAVVRIEWQAEDDVGLSEVALVLTPPGPGGGEQRKVLRSGADVRRDSGSYDLDLVPLRLAEGEALSYRLEAMDGDRVSGPKTGVSETHRVKIYSEAEHRRKVLELAKQVFEEMVALLGDRLETQAAGPFATQDRMVLADQLDLRTRQLHERMRQTARALRKDRAAPRAIATALDNVAGQLRFAEQRVSSARVPVAQALRVRIRPDPSLLRSMAAFDGQLDAELEKSILYLEQLLDKQRAEDLVRLTKDLAKNRRELADLLEKYKAAPSEAAKKELLARISRMKDRVKELLARMSETAKGFNDEHMNAEAMAEMAKSQDMAGGLDDVEKLLAQGDVEGAMKALDKMASSLDKMLAGMQRTAGMPDEKARGLMKDMLAFKEQLEQVKGEQEKVAKDTEGVQKKYKDALAERLKRNEQKLERLAKLAQEARRDVEATQPGVTYRAEPEFDQSKETLSNLERALGMKELQAALDTAQRASPAVERLARFLEEDVALSEQNPAYTKRDPQYVREAQKHARDAVPKVREIRDELAKMFPDPRQVLSQKDQQQMDQLAQRQRDLEKKAGDLQRKLSDLAQQAPVFPPSAQGQLGESRGHMGQATSQLGQFKNPQRGHGEQELALDALSRFQKGLEEAAKKGGQGGGQGFPFPFADTGGEGSGEGEGQEASREKVKIPGAEAHRVPEEFRRDLLEAMKQGTPERYRGDVQRYYEELVK